METKTEKPIKVDKNKKLAESEPKAEAEPEVELEVEYDSDDVNEQDEAEEETCNTCGAYVVPCVHGDFCFCGNLHYRGQCLLCLFDGKVYEDEWDTLAEVLDGMALRAVAIGKKYAEMKHPKPKLSKKLDPKSKNAIKALYNLFLVGFEKRIKVPHRT